MAFSNKLSSFLLAQASGNNGAIEALIDRKQSTNQLQQVASRIDAIGAQMDQVVAYLAALQTSLNAFTNTDATGPADTAVTLDAEYKDSEGKDFEPIA